MRYNVVVEDTRGFINESKITFEQTYSSNIEEQLVSVLGHVLKSHLAAHLTACDIDLTKTLSPEVAEIMTDVSLGLVIFCDAFEIKELSISNEAEPEKVVYLSDVMASYGISQSHLNDIDSHTSQIFQKDPSTEKTHLMQSRWCLLTEEEETNLVETYVQEATQDGRKTIYEPEYANLILVRTLRTIQRLFDTVRSWANAQFSANTYYWNIADRLPHCEENCSLKRFLPTETIVHHIEEVRYFIETQRLSHGLSQEKAFIPTI